MIIRYATGNGATLESLVNIAGTDLSPAGFDAHKQTPATILGGVSGQVHISTNMTDDIPTAAAYGSTFPAGAEPNALYIPFYAFGTTTVNSSSTPEYLAASTTATGGGAALWKVTSSGATFTDITPNDGSFDGVAVSSKCIAVGWKNSDLIVALLSFDGDRKLCRSINGGTSWVISSALNSAADSVQIGKRDSRVPFANGAIYGVVSDISAGTSVLSKTGPTTMTGQSTHV